MRYKSIVSYDGTAYQGWQKQNNGPSIQQEIENALKKITQQDVKIFSSGRTDGKVHAIGQVFHFDCDKSIDFKRAINSQLPKDICIKSVEAIDDNFHARFDAKWKHYDYLLVEEDYNPILRNYTGFIKEKIDIDMINEVKEVFIGTHDFTSFNSTEKEATENQIRTIYKIEVTREEQWVRFSFYGDGFLRYMVRILTATLIQAGMHKIDAKSIKAFMEAKNKTVINYNADPQGLYLIEVGYNTFIF